MNQKARQASTVPCVEWHPNGRLALTAVGMSKELLALFDRMASGEVAATFVFGDVACAPVTIGEGLGGDARGAHALGPAGATRGAARAVLARARLPRR